MNSDTELRRPNPGERAALSFLPVALDWSKVRLYRVGCGGRHRRLRRLVLTLSRGRAVALGNHVFLPARCDGDIAVLAHELVHCGQYQAWGPWRYYARGAAAQCKALVHRLFGWGSDPYAYRLEPGKPFHSYGMEQQGQIVEDSFRSAS